MPEISRSNEWPPSAPQGTESEIARMIQEEKEARRRNDEIDHMLEQERQESKRKPQVKLLLLGQAEAGKSTLLKNFQLHFAPTVFRAEAEAWRAVIHFNLVRTVNFILSSLSNSPFNLLNGAGRVPTLPSHHGRQPVVDPLRHLRMRLSPLRQVELILERRICGGTSSELHNHSESNSPGSSEFTLRVRSGWKSLIRAQRPISSSLTGHDELHDTRTIIDNCRDDIAVLWTHDLVQCGLKEGAVRLEDHCIYFLSHATRIAAAQYIPLPEDVLRARLRTVGVEEHRLVMETDPAQEWVFYDVEGCRGQRAAWSPYFDDVNVVIFLCPMSNFDSVIKEDSSVNCLLDSFQTFKAICENKMLADATFILFLNKMDLLKQKLDAGLKFSDYVPLYRDQPNDAFCIVQYFKRKFSAVHKFSSRKARALHIHTTCAIDIETMSTILGRVKDVILYTNLRATAII